MRKNTFYQQWVNAGRPVQQTETKNEFDIEVVPLSSLEIKKYIEELVANTPLNSPYVSLLVSDAVHNPVDFSWPNGNRRHKYEYTLEKEFAKGSTFYITAVEALLFGEHFGSMRVHVKPGCILPLKYFVFRDYGIIPDEKQIINQIEWNVQDHYRQFGR